jgi:hypothetical protein
MAGCEDDRRDVVRDMPDRRYNGVVDTTGEDDFAACAPMFACIPAGNLWLAAQDRGEATYTTYRIAAGYDEARDEEPGVEEITGIWFTLADARATAGGEPIGLSRNMTGWWLYPEEGFALPE